jgi:hypothetical protein
MTTDKLNTFDRLNSSNAERVAKILGETGICSKRILPSLEDRTAVVQMMSSEIKWGRKSQWDLGGSDLAPWHMVACAKRSWSDFGDLLSGDAFLGCLARSLDLGGSGWSGMAVSPHWDATAAEIIEATRQHFVESHEDGKIDEDDEAVLNLPPALIVAVHLRMEGHFMECIRDQPDLIMDGSIESIQRDIQKRWGKVIEALVESRRKDAEAASA